MTTLRDPETVTNLAVILKTNVRACKSLGQSYFVQLASIYLDMLNVYSVRPYFELTAVSLPFTVLHQIIKTIK